MKSMSEVVNNVPSGIQGKEKVIFGNMEEIYDFHKEWVGYTLIICLYYSHNNASQIISVLVKALTFVHNVYAFCFE